MYDFKRHKIDFESKVFDKIYYHYNTSEILFKNDGPMKSKATIFVLKIITVLIIFMFFSYHLFIWIKPNINFVPFSLYMDQIKVFSICKKNLNKDLEPNETLLRTNSSISFDKNRNFNSNNNNKNQEFSCSMTNKNFHFEDDMVFNKIFNHSTKNKQIFDKKISGLTNSGIDNDKFRIDRILFEKIIKASINKNDSFVKTMMKINKNINFTNKQKIKHKNLTNTNLMKNKILVENLQRNIRKVLIL
jgi:hypothetical protein